MRLVDSSDPNAVNRFNVRAHYYERLVLTASVCRELKSAGDQVPGFRPRTALTLLARWMRDSYDLPAGHDINFSHGLDDPRLTEFANDLWRELVFGAAVCNALAKSYTADKSWEYESDIAHVQQLLRAYLTKFEQ